MRISGIDHMVITTENAEVCIAFYTEILGMELDCSKGRIAFRFGNQKINVHRRKAEYLPASKNPTVGSVDLCIIAEGSIEEIQTELKNKGAVLETGIVFRNGAKGKMSSIYLRDPDGNLIEIGVYPEG
ncbi:VOC family protein [Gottschalkiaceae bacterium SANA]|nr:VOC family protein [Gottschalkiaceae bacterium SANA]